MALTAEQRSRRAHIANMKRHHPNKPELFEDAQRRMKVERWAREAPPLSDADIERLRELLPPVDNRPQMAADGLTRAPEGQRTNPAI